MTNEPVQWHTTQALRGTLHPAATPAGGTSPRLRQGITPNEVRNAIQRLSGRFRPLDPDAERLTALRSLPNFYPQEIVGPINSRLLSAAVNGGRCYIQGATFGVGVSTLLTDFANGFNLCAHDTGDPRRIAKIELEPGSRSVPKFIDALAWALRAPVSTTELRFRSAGQLARRIISTAELTGVSALIIDHVGNASGAVLEAIGHVILATDPRYTVAWEKDELATIGWRIGIVLADHRPPEQVFRASANILLSLDLGTVTLPPYTTFDHIADAIHQADIGLHDLDLNDRNDREIVERVLEITDGLVARLLPLLRLTDLAARTSTIDRPNLACLEAAARIIPKLVTRVSRPNPFLNEEQIHDLLVRPAPQHGLEPDEGSARSADPKDASRSEKLRQKHETRHLAADEGRKMRRRRHRG